MTRHYAVIGDPVSHSLSPLLHNGWIADHGIDATYEAYQLRSEDPVAAIRALTRFDGMNVTVPHKQAAAQAAERSQGEVANVLRREADGSLSAFNTDGPGFLRSLDEGAPGWRESVRRALVLGAGGAAQAIARALSPMLGSVLVANRTRKRAESLANALPNGRTMAWADLPLGFAEADLIVQATTLGMETGMETPGLGTPGLGTPALGTPALGTTGEAQTEPPNWPFDMCAPHTIAVDIVYRPLETSFLAAARARGLACVDGLGMLVQQGALAFEIWHGVTPDTARARARLVAALT